ncbi:unnamed protein product [Protopolystoma xenopodis]|uniref:Uncharacterized protein n=1 Tax=Protopolystoma xenopodis TaxID=117903 RepID=A0A448X0A4_9PLAT|nr:unnamed protein product [Protopolystoma xenopodis]
MPNSILSAQGDLPFGPYVGPAILSSLLKLPICLKVGVSFISLQKQQQIALLAEATAELIAFVTAPTLFTVSLTPPVKLPWPIPWTSPSDPAIRLHYTNDS